jgi:methylaspartate mutase sigma subunit
VSGAGGLEIHARPVRKARGRTVIVSSVASDSHTWNLVFLQLLIEELGYDVINLGACVPDDLLVTECVSRLPAMVVVSSVNGHGYQEGLRVVKRLRARPELAGIPMVIGGKLGISGGESQNHLDDLLAAGYDAVFDDRDDGPASFRHFVASIAEGPRLDRLEQAGHELR